MAPNVEILKKYSKIQEYLPEIVAAADSHRNELGFIPRSAYDQQAQQDKLWVAVSEGEYSGHLIFGGTHPILKISQIYVPRQKRGLEIGRRLIDELKDVAIKRNCLSIVARVAADLDGANNFWASIGFRAVTQQHGGVSRDRRIIVRVYTVPGMSLFPAAPQASGLATRVLRHREIRLTEVPSFALDLNVLFDLTKSRPNSAEAAGVLRCAMTGQLKLYVTSELPKELERSAFPKGADPFLDFARNLPQLPEVGGPSVENDLLALRAIVFPLRKADRRRGAQDESDLKHIAAAIHHGMYGFITSEKAILQKSQEILQHKSLTIMSPADFLSGPGTVTLPSNWSANTGRGFQIVELKEAWREPCRTFLQEAGCEPSHVNAILAPGSTKEPRRRYCLLDGGAVFGLGAWSPGAIVGPAVAAYLIVDEDHAGTMQFVNTMLEIIARENATFVGREISLCVGIGQSVTQSLASDAGYTSDLTKLPAGIFNFFRKFAFSGVATPENWPEFLRLSGHTDLEFPKTMPAFKEVDRDGLNILKRNNNNDFIDLFDFESYFKPVLFLFSQRPCALIPIKASFAEDLLGALKGQMSLLPGHASSFKPLRAYFRKPSHTALVQKGTPILFYASGKIGAAIGCARVVEGSICHIDKIALQVVTQGVLTTKQLKECADKAGNVHVILFEGFQPFRNPVTGQELKKLGAGKANFITIQRLESQQFVEACRTGFRGSDVFK